MYMTSYDLIFTVFFHFLYNMCDIEFLCSNQLLRMR